MHFNLIQTILDHALFFTFGEGIQEKCGNGNFHTFLFEPFPYFSLLLCFWIKMTPLCHQVERNVLRQTSGSLLTLTRHFGTLLLQIKCFLLDFIPWK